MSDINNVCEELVGKVPSAVGAAVVDLESGFLLAAHHTIHYFTQEYLDAVAAAAVDMFRGTTVQNVENVLAAHRGVPPRRLINEVQMSTDHTYHFMIVVPEKPNFLVVLITTKKANLGMGWTHLRMAVPELTKMLP